MDEHEVTSQLTDQERLVLDAVREAGPLDAIGISSQTRLPVAQVLELIESLKGKGIVTAVEPEPVHARIEPVAV